MGTESLLAIVAGLTPESTVGEARSAGKALKKALKSIESAERELAKASVRAYRDQVRIFRDAVEDMQSQKDMTLEEAAQQLKGAAAPVIAARLQLDATIECPERTPSTISGPAEGMITSVDFARGAVPPEPVPPPSDPPAG